MVTQLLWLSEVVLISYLVWSFLVGISHIPGYYGNSAEELLIFYSGCHGYLVTTATSYVAMPIVSGNLGTKYEFNRM